MGHCTRTCSLSTQKGSSQSWKKEHNIWPFCIYSATDINITKKRNWYIMSPMKNQKHQFYNFCMKFSISKHHRRRNFLAFQLREGRKRSGKFTANPDYTFYRLWIPRLLQSLFLVNSQENQQKFKFSFPLSAARNW